MHIAALERSRADDLRGRRHHPPMVNRSPRIRLTPELRYSFGDPGAEGWLRTEYFEIMAAAPSITTAGSPRRMDCASRAPDCPPAFGRLPTTTRGSSTTWTRIGARPAISRPRCTTSSLSAGPLPDRGHEKQGAPYRRRSVDCRPAPKSASLRRTPNRLSRVTRCACLRSRSHCNTPNLVTTMPTFRTVRAVCSTRSARTVWPHRLPRRRLSVLRVFPLLHPAHRPVQPASPRGQGEDRGRDDPALSPSLGGPAHDHDASEWRSRRGGRRAPISAPLLFTAKLDRLDVALALGSPVSLDYFEGRRSGSTARSTKCTSST